MHPAARPLILALVAALALAAFTWPSANLEPRDLPVGVVGAAPPALAQNNGIDVRTYPTEAAARDGVMDRDVYGAIAGGTTLVATGASPTVAALLRDAAPPDARVVDLAPGTANDPRGATVSALALPLTLLGIVTAILAVFTGRSTRDRIGLIGAAAVLIGLVAALLTHTWLDALPGPWLATAGAVTLAVAAIAATVTGLAGLIGKPGIGVGAVLMMLVGNPWSGLSSAPELMPDPAGAIGQLLPTGAAGDLLRSGAWFDGADAAGPLVVLGTWALAGLAMIAAAAWRRREPATAHGAVAATA